MRFPQAQANQRNKMKITLLVSMTIEDDADLVRIAAEVSDKLSNDFAVITVKPWSRPKTAPSAQGKAVLRSFLDIPPR